jgi:glyoxalase family protein
VPANLPGIHHVTCITGDVQKCVDFYVSALGLRFIKKSINQDKPDTYHIYFGDQVGSPGTAMTFFGWPSWPARRAGSGQVTTVAFSVPQGSLDFWNGRLLKLGVKASRASRFGTDTIVLTDPDGIELELVAKSSNQPWVPWPDSPVDAEHAIRGFHSVTMTVAKASATFDLLVKTMGFRKTGQEGRRTRFETGQGGPHAILDVVESPEGPEGEESIGTVHHVAWRAADAAHQAEWREVLVAVGRNVTPVIDRYYFKSIYSREPGGVLFEIATDGPGFTMDETVESLGSSLSLPPWFQVRRDRLDQTLPPIVVPTTATTGAGH